MSTEKQEVAEKVQCVTNASNTATAGAGFTSLGKCLQQARVLAGYTVQQIASEMHLDVWQIEYIERDCFKELGAPVFVKGYLRRYARVVNVDEALMQGLYEALRDPPLAVDPIPSCMNSVPVQRKLLPGWSLWVAAGLFVVISLGTVINKLTSHSDVQNAATPSNVHVESTATVESLASQQTSSVTNEAPKESSLLASVTPVATANAGELQVTNDASLPLQAGRIALTLKFTGDSWAEVYDANKRVVLYEMGHENTVRKVSGLAPLNVVIGSKRQVDLQINGHAMAIPAKRVTADVARFIVNADGLIN